MNLIIAVITLAGALIIIATIIIIRVRYKVPNMFKRAEILKDRTKYDEALELYDKLLEKIDPVDENPEIHKIKNRSLLACGNIYENTGKKKLAYESYRKANQAGALLTTGIIGFSAQYCLDEEIINDYSINIFILFLLQRPDDKIAGKIDALLAKRLYINEKSSKEAISQTFNACELILGNKVQNISGKTGAGQQSLFGWVNTFAGICYLLNNDIENALTRLQLAVKSGKLLEISRYWLANAMILQLKRKAKITSDLYSPIIELLSEFSVAETSGTEIKEKQKLAGHKLGVILVKKVAAAMETIKEPFVLQEADREDLRKALKFLSASISDNIKDDDLASLYAGKAHALLDEYAQAIKYYEAALEVSGNDPLILYNIGLLHYKLGKFEGARIYLQRCLAVDSSNIPALQLLINIHSLAEQYPEVEVDYLSLKKLNEVSRDIEFKYLKALFLQNKFREITEIIKYNDSGFYDQDPEEEISFYIGRSYVHQRRWEESLRYLKHLSEKPEYVYFYGYALANLGLFNKAESALSQVSTDEPGLQKRISLLKGHICMNFRKFENAESIYLDLYNSYPSDEEINRALGYLYLNMDNPDESRKYFGNILSINASSFDAVAGLAIGYEMQKNFRESVRYFTDAMNIDNQNWIHLRLGINYTFMEEFGNAIKFLESYSDHDEKDDKALFFLGFANAKLGNYEEAIRLWETLLERFPEDPMLKQRLAVVKFNLGNKLVEEGEIEKAIPYLESYYFSFPEDESAGILLGQIHLKAGSDRLIPDIRNNYEEVRDLWFKKGLSFDHNNISLLFFLALIEIELGNCTKARGYLKRLLEMDPSNIKYRYFLSVVKLSVGDRDSALQELKDLIGGDHANGIGNYARRTLANEYMKDSKFNDALILLKQLV